MTVVLPEDRATLEMQPPEIIAASGEPPSHSTGSFAIVLHFFSAVFPEVTDLCPPVGLAGMRSSRDVKYAFGPGWCHHAVGRSGPRAPLRSARIDRTVHTVSPSPPRCG